MKIKAIQKLTLLDFPNRTAATVFTCGCNLRCPFCHNASLVVGDRCPDGSMLFDEEAMVPEEEVFSLLEKRRGLLDGVAITGGEPLLQPDLADFIRKIKNTGFAVKLDTNGFLPERLEKLLAEGLVDYVAMDVKHAPEKYGLAAGIEGLSPEPFLRSIELIKNSGIEYEFRTTLVKGIHKTEDIAEIAKIVGEGSPYYIQMYVDSGDVLANRDGSSGLCPFTAEEAEEVLQAVREYNSGAKLRGI